LDESLSILHRPPEEIIRALEAYPDSIGMPQALLFELMLNRAEAGDFAGAIGLFPHRFYLTAEGDTDVRQVWLEVHLQKAVAEAQSGDARAALEDAAHLSDAVPGLEFTQSGLLPLIENARTKYLLGELYERCGRNSQAAECRAAAARATAPDQVSWAAKAARKLGSYDRTRWNARLAAALLYARSRVAPKTLSFWTYACAMLEEQLGDSSASAADLQQILLLPDNQMAYHLRRMANATDLYH